MTLTCFTSANWKTGSVSVPIFPFFTWIILFSEIDNEFSSVGSLLIRDLPKITWSSSPSSFILRYLPTCFICWCPSSLDVFPNSLTHTIIIWIVRNLPRTICRIIFRQKYSMGQMPRAKLSLNTEWQMYNTWASMTKPMCSSYSLLYSGSFSWMQFICYSLIS